MWFWGCYNPRRKIRRSELFFFFFCDIKMTQPTVGLPPPYPDFGEDEEEEEENFGYELAEFGRAASVLCKSSLFFPCA